MSEFPNVQFDDTPLVYAGFWIRVGASLIDTLLLSLIILPIILMAFGPAYLEDEQIQVSSGSFVINYILPAIVVIVFWIYKSATPGKMILRLKIVDAKTGGKPSTPQFVVRYLGYYLASIPLGLGIFWVGFDKRKQGWHDKLASTLVIRYKSRGTG